MDKRVKKTVFYFFMAVLVLAVLLIFNWNNDKEDEEFHVHADFKVYVNNSFKNFTDERFQSTAFSPKHPSVHLHDFNEKVIHYHARNISLGEFFSSINITFTDECFIDERGNEYCTNETHTLNTYVNGNLIEMGPSYVANDLDRILIVHQTSDTDVESLFNNVSDEACIQSALCPERGEPSEGSCVTGEVCQIDMSQFT